MNELSELESGIERLKRDSQSKKALIAALEREKQELLRRSEEISDRLRKTNEAYRESHRKVMDYVNAQVSQLRADFAGLSSSLEGLSGLEKRLEAQGERHDKSLDKIEKQLVLTDKGLSDLEKVRSEVSRQGSFLQEAKLQMDKSLQSGMAYLRKEMEVSRKEESKVAREEFRQEIERIASLEGELNLLRRSQSGKAEKLL